MVRLSTRTKEQASQQEVETPADFIEAVVKRFAPIAFDLAASARNTQASRYYSVAEDSLEQNWCELSHTLDASPGDPKLLWLNPEFNHIEPWAAKCHQSGPLLAPWTYIAFLTPASVGANWFSEHVWNQSAVKFLNGRLHFVGHNWPFPKDCQLAIYGDVPAFAEIWKWKAT